MLYRHMPCKIVQHRHWAHTVRLALFDCQLLCVDRSFVRQPVVMDGAVELLLLPVSLHDLDLLALLNLVYSVECLLLISCLKIV